MAGKVNSNEIGGVTQNVITITKDYPGLPAGTQQAAGTLLEDIIFAIIAYDDTNSDKNENNFPTDLYFTAREVSTFEFA